MEILKNISFLRQPLDLFDHQDNDKFVFHEIGEAPLLHLQGVSIKCFKIANG